MSLAPAKLIGHADAQDYSVLDFCFGRNKRLMTSVESLLINYVRPQLRFCHRLLFLVTHGQIGRGSGTEDSRHSRFRVSAIQS
eukprot:g80409.t1